MFRRMGRSPSGSVPHSIIRSGSKADRRVDLKAWCVPDAKGRDAAVKILVVGDGQPYLDELELQLCNHGHDVRRTCRFTIADLTAKFDFVVLDLDLTHVDGFEVCQEIRHLSTVPIVALSGSSDEVDRLLGLRLGADDCVTKTSSVREVTTRIEAVARRSLPSGVGRRPVKHLLRVGALCIDLRTRTARLDDVEIYLARKEFDLLVMLAENAGSVCQRDQIMKRVWGENWFGPTRTLDVHVGYLRRKLGPACSIKTVRGVGFWLKSNSS